MTLTSRLSLVFLTTLAIVLAGFSTTLYLAARIYLYRQSEERLDATLNTLAAAVDFGPEGLEWEPTERRLSLGNAAFSDEVVWLVRDERGRVVDRSKLPAADFATEPMSGPGLRERTTKRLDWQGKRWQFQQRWLETANQQTVPGTLAPGGPPADWKKHIALSITAGIPLAPIESALRYVAGVLVGLSLAIWLVVLCVNQQVCRRALLPVRRMAATARALDIEGLERRLPALATKDELEDLNHSFNNLLDRLQESFLRQQRFTGDASHQLRTPLAAILGQTEVALRRPRSPDEYERVLASVHRQADQLRRIVEALLFLARANNDASVPERASLDLKSWLPAFVQSWSERERGQDIVFEVVGAASHGVHASPVLLGELLRILLDNACKYSLPGTRIALRLRRDGQAVYVEVEDHGYGIEPDDMALLFTPFFRAAATRRRGIEGVGLGLSIAKRLAQACGGDLTATSQTERGSCFSLRLPM